jgi:hypothetical protein
VVVVLLVVAAGCRDGDESSGAAPGDRSRAEEAFCEAWAAGVAGRDEAAMDALLDDAPPALADDAAVVRAIGADDSGSPEVEAAVTRILDWTELHCRRAAPGESPRRIAPPVEAAVDGLTFCGNTPPLASRRDDRSGMVLYGNATGDPYDGPMLGVLWAPAGGGGFGGDGDQHPVTVRGRSGVAAPITVFQQAVVPELGTVIAWTEGDVDVGLYGRRWSLDRASELVAIADRLEAVGDGFRIPDQVVPGGHDEVYTGSAAVTSLVPTPWPLYSVRYQGSEGLLSVDGLQMAHDEFEAFRFLTVDVDRRDVGGREALVGLAWGERGPSVVTWREPDGLVVRIVGIGVPLDTALEVAVATEDLPPRRWTALVEAEGRCQDG